jgi:CBS domain-containing protein
MSRGVETIRPDASLFEAAQRMRSLDVGPLPVEDNGRLIGMLTDRDIVVRAVADGQDPMTTTVADAMTANLIYCTEDQDVREVARLMEQHQVRRLVVVDRDRALTGIVSLGDIVLTTGDEQLAGEALERISEPAPAETEIEGTARPAA